MKKFSREIMWSILNLSIDDKITDTSIIDKCFHETELFEKKYSRFLKNSFLNNLNKNKSSQETPWELLSILKLTNKVSILSKWYFDITILPFLENIWYWIKNNFQEEKYWYQNIIIEENKIILKNWVSIDIWSVGKWYMVDKIYNILDKEYQNFVVDFWWDIRVKWKQKIYLEDPINLWNKIWYIELENWSVAWSSSNRRKTNEWSHLINPKKDYKEDKLAVFTIHKLSSFSDILSTAIFVSPIKISMEIINKTKWLEAMIIMKNWDIYKTKWFNLKKD